MLARVGHSYEEALGGGREKTVKENIKGTKGKPERNKYI